MGLQHPFTVTWIVIAAAITVVEVTALLNKEPGDTLSEHIFAWFSTKGKGRWWRLRRFVLLVAMAYLSIHFLSGGTWI